MTLFSTPPLNRRTIQQLFLALTLTFFISSCEESEHFFLLNPDGSGRVTAKEKILTSNMGIKGREALQHAAISTLAEMVLVSKGVDAWENVAYNITEEGDLELEATLLFPDINKLDLASSAQVPSLFENLKFQKGDNGKPSSIELVSPITAGDQQKLPAEPKVDEKTITAELRKTRVIWLGAEENIRPEYGQKKAKVTFHLSGEIKSQTNFTQEAKNQLSLQLGAQQAIDTMGRVISDDKLATDVLKTGGKILSDDGVPPIKPEIFNKLSFGKAAPLRFEFTSGPMLFDYHSAVDSAKANPSPLLTVVQAKALEAAASK